jgi:hypothetical protein
MGYIDAWSDSQLVFCQEVPNMRTTLDIEKPVLVNLKELARKRRRSMSCMASDLLAEALSRAETSSPSPVFSWNSKNMGARVEVDDKEAIYELLDIDKEGK